MGINWKGVSDYHLKLQLKKLSRTGHIWNFPTQGCGAIKFYTIFWDSTYIYFKDIDIHISFVAVF